MIRNKRSLVALIALLAIGAAACGSSSGSSGGGGSVPTGGTLVLGAEQEPPCADWIDSDARKHWGSGVAANGRRFRPKNDSYMRQHPHPRHKVFSAH